MVYVSSSCVQGEKIGQILKLYAENDITHIELSGGTSYYPEIEQDLQTYKQRYGMDYVCHAYFPPPKEDFVVNLASCNDEIYEKSISHYMDCLELLKKIDCHVLSIHAGFFIEILPNEIGKALSDSVIYPKEESLQRFCEAYKKIEAAAGQCDITMYLENNVLSLANYERFKKQNHLMMTDFEGFQELRERLEFNLLLDVGHLHVSSGTLHKNFKKECVLFREHVKWLHVSENNGVADEHRALDEQSDIVDVLGTLIKKDMNITLETNADISEIKRSKALIDKILG